MVTRLDVLNALAAPGGDWTTCIACRLVPVGDVKRVAVVLRSLWGAGMVERFGARKGGMGYRWRLTEAGRDELDGVL